MATVAELKKLIVESGHQLPSRGSGSGANGGVIKIDLINLWDRIQGNDEMKDVEDVEDDEDDEDMARPLEAEVMYRSDEEASGVFTGYGMDYTKKYCGQFINLLIDDNYTSEQYEQNKKRKACVDVPDFFVNFAVNLFKVIPDINDWDISYHTKMPGIQFINKKDTTETKLPIDNHFSPNNPTYCYCTEDNIEKSMLSVLENEDFKDHLQYSVVLSSFEEGIEDMIIQTKELVVRRQAYTRNILIITSDNGTTYEFSSNSNEASAIYDAIMTGQNFEPTVFTVVRNSLTAEEKHKIKEDAKQGLVHKFKIHLQPKAEYQIWTIREMLKIFADPKINKYVSAWKTIIPYDRVFDEQLLLPAIVIYPTYGRESASVIIKALISHFGQFQDVGLNITPRFNFKVNSLIYWSGGNGDDKSRLIKSRKIDEFFDWQNNYANYIFPGGVLDY